MRFAWSPEEFLDEFLWDGWAVQADRRNGIWDQLWDRINESKVAAYLPSTKWGRRGAAISVVVIGIILVMQLKRDTSVGRWLRRFLNDARRKNVKRVLDGTARYPIY